MPQNTPAPLWVSQNFLTSPALIDRLLRLSSINKGDHVVEIGAGKGHITRRLCRRCGLVSAVEIDDRLCGRLRESLRTQKNVRVIRADFLRWPLPQTPYKIFANIPFSHTTEIVRRITQALRPPEEAWLVMEKGAARRFMGGQSETLFSLLIKPWFELEVTYHFRREDFHPAPSVDTVLLHLRRKPEPDIEPRQRGRYTRFVTACMKAGSGGFGRYLTKKQVATALRLAGLPAAYTPRETLYVQWLCLFRCWRRFGAD